MFETGEPLGLLALVAVVLIALGGVWAVSWLVTAAVDLYASTRFKDPEARKKYLEGDE